MALVGAFSVIVQPVVEPMDRFAALVQSLALYEPVRVSRRVFVVHCSGCLEHCTAVNDLDK